MEYNIHIGLDEPHQQAFDVCRDSILQYPSKHTINTHAINYNTVEKYNRIRDEFESTQFSFARFFVPWESDFTGVSMFVDGDFLFLRPIDQLLDLYDPSYAVMCCPHDYTPVGHEKMDGKIQSIYPRKNWSSLMMFNNEHPDVRKLTPDVVNTQSGKFLHRFEWVSDEIGYLPVEWNWLVGWYDETPSFHPRALHYTEGGPWLEEFSDCSYSDVWYDHAQKFGHVGL